MHLPAQMERGGEMETSFSRFQKVLETVEALPSDEQSMLIEIVHQRLIRQRRGELAAEITEARAAYQTGQVRRGTVADLMEDLAR
jgi:hypothetical protein